MKRKILILAIALTLLISAQAETVYCTTYGTYYHRVKDCSGMMNASAMSVAAARESLNKAACPVCVGRDLGDASLPLSAASTLAVASLCGLYVADQKRRRSISG